ncbi:MAG TPA: polysaccharide deacetylase family protein [Gemmatimonadales bacterium]|nr:polysaccharide deacetylase family protein [Gemmatimonadales bacterium]
MRHPLSLASLGYGALRLIGVTAVARRLRNGGLVLCYHNVVPDGDPGAWGALGLHMPFSTFARQMRWLAATYAVVPLDRLVEGVARRENLRGKAAVTFDDAYVGVFDYALPLLRELDLPATVFVVAQAPGSGHDFWWDHPSVLRVYSDARRERWLTQLRGDGTAIIASLDLNGDGPLRPPPACRPADWPTIAAAARAGLSIGAHSATHRALTTLGRFDLDTEVNDSREAIARHTGVVPDVFAYPYGLSNEHVREVVRAAGYRAAFTLDRGHGPDAWSLGRLNVPAGISDAAFDAWTVGLHP